jgi:hypothetical protein
VGSLLAGLKKMELDLKLGWGGGKLGSNAYVFMASGGELKTWLNWGGF